jgi:rod shape-determining protein MreD
MALFIPHLDGVIGKITPLFVTLIFLLCSIALPFIMPIIADIPPLLVLIAVYYWSVHRPDLMPLPIALLLGLLTDTLLRLPFGVSALSYICSAQLVQSQRPIFVDQSYLTLWLGFVVVLALSQTIHWALFSLLTKHIMPIMPLLLQGLLTLAIFPLLVWLLILLHRHIVHE